MHAIWPMVEDVWAFDQTRIGRHSLLPPSGLFVTKILLVTSIMMVRA